MTTPPPAAALRIDAEGAPFAVLVNGAPVWEDRRGRAAVVDRLPVVEWLATGPNTLTIRLGGTDHQSPAPSGRCEVALVARAPGPGAFATVATLGLSPAGPAGSPPGRFEIVAESGQVVADDHGRLEVGPIERVGGPESRAARRTVSLPWHLPRWRHLDAPTILASSRTASGLGAAYRRVWDLLRHGDREGLGRILAPKVAELTAAYPDDRSHIAPILGLETYLDDPSLVLRPLELERCQLEVFEHGTLARLTDSRGASPVAFGGPGGLVAYVELAFCLAGSEWVAVR